MHSRERLHYFYIYSVCSAALFLLGLTICYLLPDRTYIYKALQSKVIDSVAQNANFKLSSLSASICTELKLFILVFISAFCFQRHRIFLILTSAKGFFTGICTSCFIQAVRSEAIIARHSAFCCFMFTILSTFAVCLLCFFAAHSIIFSKKLTYPVKIKQTIKRKDTLNYLIDTLAYCGLVLIIILLKHGNLMLSVSSKGM